MAFILENYLSINKKILENGNKTKLIAISKYHTKNSIELAINQGIRLFGENRVQEAYLKYQTLKELYPDIELHFTGNLQTNKIKQSLKIFDYYHTLYNERQLKEFSKFPEQTENKKFFIQVNTGLEKTKTGLNPDDVEEFLKISKNNYKINILGLMCIPPINEKPSKHFMLLKNLKEKLGLKKLSMGMSADYEEAIKCGSDYIRIGTMIFGDRN